MINPRGVCIATTLCLTLAAAAALADPPMPPRPAETTVIPHHPDDELHRGVAVPDDLLQRAALAYHAQRRRRALAMTDGTEGALAGRVIGVSPGHGIHWVETSDGNPIRDWRFQRGVTNEIREDIHTAQLVNDFLADMLERSGARVVHMRERGYDAWATVIDNDAGDGYSETGVWETGGAEGFGGTYRFAYLDPQGSAEVSWTVEVPSDGNYPVYVHFLASANRAEVARYRVDHAYGRSERWLRQSEELIEEADYPYSPNPPPPSDAERAPADLWHLLGHFPFRSGETYTVTLSNRGDDGARVVIADGLRVGAGLGEVTGSDGSTSGLPRWQEAADTFLEWIGRPAWLDVNDVIIRPLYGVYRGIDAYVAIHTNATSGSATGTSTWTWYPEMWIRESSWPADFIDTQLPPGTYELSDQIHRDVIARLRGNWDPEWADRGHWGANFGELRPLRYGWYNDVNVHDVSPPLTVPGMLMEVAFHTEPYDSRLLAEQRFRHDVARGFLAGLIRFFNGDDALLPPLAPAAVSATAGPEGVLIRWADQQDPLAPEALADGYRVYWSTDGLLFDPEPFEVTERQLLLPADDCQPLYVRVTAVNAAGESLDSPVVGARQALEGGARILIVDGVDRERKVAADPNNVRSWARIYGPAASLAANGAGFDIATDEGVATALESAPYDLVIWATGETSVRWQSLSAADRLAIGELRAAGAALLISGAELGYHLSRGDADEVRFLAEILGVAYVSDDADTTLVDASALGLASGIAFGDCSADAICVEWPDVLAPIDGGDIVVRYAGGTAAAVRSADGTVITAGFPLESVAEPTERTDLIAALAAELLDPELASSGACPAVVVEPADVGGDASQDMGPDAVSLPDAGGGADGGTMSDSSVAPNADAATRQTAKTADGCGCRATDASGAGVGALWFGLLLGLLGVKRRQ